MAFLLALVALVLAGFTPAFAQGAGGNGTASHRTPVVVELYTSQGCSSCPRANRLLGQWAREDGVIALTFPVGYWDYLGWVDTFAQPEFTDRQRAYSRALHTRAPFTPQIVIDGMRQITAADWDEGRATLQEVQAMPVADGAPNLTIHRLANNQVRVTVGASSRRDLRGDIWLIAFDPGPLTVQILRGENAGRQVAHYNLVRRVTRIGSWSGNATWFERPRCLPQCAVIVQADNGGRILSAAVTHPETREARR